MGAEEINRSNDSTGFTFKITPARCRDTLRLTRYAVYTVRRKIGAASIQRDNVMRDVLSISCVDYGFIENFQ